MSDEEKTLPDQENESDAGDEKADDATQEEMKDQKDDSSTENQKDEEKTVEEPTVPEKYEFKVPKGVEPNKDLVKDLAAFAREKKLTQDEAQKVFDIQVKATQDLFATVEKEEKRIRDEMKQRVKEDPVMGKKENLALAVKAIDGYGSKMTAEERKELREWFDNGPGDFLPLARFLHFIGKDISDDILVMGEDAQNARDKQQKQLKKMYPSSFKK